MFGLKSDWSLDISPRYFTLDNYEGGQPRWCTGCGDFAILSAVQKLCRDKQIPPEKMVTVSGIGCSSRMPHYVSSYGFHGLHGRALTVACGIKSRRKDLHVWVATGDGDCYSIGAGHWIHAVRYNMDMTVLVFDNNIYGLTKEQTSPTSQAGTKTNTHPAGAPLPALNPLTTTLGITNASFVAQTVDWNPPHLFATLKAAHEHKGLSFVSIMQRCPVFSEDAFKKFQNDTSRIVLLNHDNGIPLDEKVARIFPNHLSHDPANLSEARDIAEVMDPMPIGLLYHNPDLICYDDISSQGGDVTNEEKMDAINRAMDKFAI